MLSSAAPPQCREELRMTDTPVIDEHRHIGNCESRGNPTMDDIIADLDRTGTDFAVIAPGSPPTDAQVSRQEEWDATMDLYKLVGEYLENGINTPYIERCQRATTYHDDVLKAVRQSDGRLLGCWWLNPRLGPDAYDEARAAVRDYRLRYIKLHPPCHAFAADDPTVLGPAMDLAAELDVPLWIHSSSGPGTETERLVKLARLFPKNNIIMGHVLSCGLLPEDENTPKVIAAANAAPNLWIDLAGCPFTSMRRVLSEAPQDRIMMGTDTPWHHDTPLDRMIPAIREATADNADLRHGILGGNAARLLGIPH